MSITRLTYNREHGGHYGAKRHQDNLNIVRSVRVSCDRPIPVRAYASHYSPVHLVDYIMMRHLDRYYPGSLVTIHDTIGVDYYREDQWMFDTLPFINHIITVSAYSSHQIERVFDRMSFVVPNGVDTSKFYADTTMTDNTTIKLLYVGNTMPHKNTPYLIDIAAALQKCTDKHVIVQRAGYSDNIPYQKAEELTLRTKAQRYGVDFRDLGYVPSIRQTYNEADVYISPSFYEGFDLPIIEAMACGTPVVASNCTSHPEVVGDAGKLVPYETSKWVDAILDVIERPPTEAMHRNVTKFSWEAAAAKLMKVYEEVSQ